MAPELALEVCRFLHYAATMLLWGAFGLLLALGSDGPALATASRLEGFRRNAISVAFVATFLSLPVRAAMIGDGWFDAVNPAILWPVLIETHVGRAWIAEAIGSVLLVGTLLVGAGHRTSATVLMSGLLLATVVLTGHAAMHEGAVGWLHRVNDLVHVLASGAWLGALLSLTVILSDSQDCSDADSMPRALRFFSVSGHVVVALTVLTGVINTLLVLGRWPTQLSSPYQALLAAKIALVGLMVCVAISNRYRQMPAFGLNRAATIRAIRLGAMSETALGLGVIGLVAVLGTFEPM